MINDTSSDEGSVTPELSGFYSNVYADGKLGVSVSASYAERESGSQQAEVGTGWRSFEARQHQDWSDGGNAAWGGVPYENQVNRVDPNSSDIYSVPQTTIYKFEEQQRKRLNSQLVLQYQLTDDIRMTFDALYIEKEVDLQYNDVSAWFTFAPSENTWTDGPVSSPLLYSEVYGDDNLQDLSMGARDSATKEQTTMLGFNIEWQVNDNLKVDFDHHSSSAKETPNSALGSANTLSVMARVRSEAATDFSGVLPTLAVKGSAGITPADMEVAGSWFRNDRSTVEVDQTQANATYELDELGSIDFGLSMMTTSNHRQEAKQVQNDTWGGMGTGVFDASYFPEESVQDKFDHVEGGMFADFGGASEWEIVDTIYMWDFATVRDRAEELYTVATDSNCGTNFCPSSNYAEGLDRFVEEEMTSLYFQYNYFGEIGDIAYDLHFGIRHESTEITSRSAVPTYQSVTSWKAETEHYLNAVTTADGGPQFEYQTRTGSYTHTLPTFNINFELTEDVVARFAYGKTIGRPWFGDMLAGKKAGTGFNEGGASFTTGNPGLLPLESTNLDLSIEYYYDEGSYVALGYFDKTVTNGIDSVTETENLFGARTVVQGPRYMEAGAAVGFDNKIAMREWIYDNYNSTDAVFLDENGNIVINSTDEDPLLGFVGGVPTNSDDEQGYSGLEFTVQHLFGESGFGTITNYTKVDTDNEFNNLLLDQGGVNAETNISDSANVIAFYDNDGLQARIAYNWRDEFLVATGDGTGANPTYTEAYSQIDFNVSYDVAQVEGLTVFVEGINITNEYTRKHGRSSTQLLNLTQTGARYALGARYSF